jgi:hypothetical protein
LVALALLASALGPLRGQAPDPQQMAAAVREIESYAAEMSKANAALQPQIRQVFDALESDRALVARLQTEQFPGVVSTYRELSQLSRDVGAAATVQDQIRSLGNWAAAMRNHGVVDQRFLEEIRTRVKEWRARYDRSSQEMASVRAVLLEMQQRPLPPGCQASESPDCIAARGADTDRRVSAERTLSDIASAFRTFESDLSIQGPAPPAAECVGNDPEALRIDAGRSSAVVGETSSFRSWRWTDGSGARRFGRA